MKKMNRLMAFVAIVLSVSISSLAQNAQNGFSLRIGGSFPVDAFDKEGSMSGISIDNAAETMGNAALGWNAGLKLQMGLPLGLGLFVSGDVFYSDVRGEYTDMFTKAGMNEDVMLPLCYNFPVLAGLNWQVLNLKVLQLWAEAGVGVNLHNVLSLDEAFGIAPSQIKASDVYRMAAGVAWQTGVGVTIGGKVSLGVHYYALGTQDIESGKSGMFDDWADKLAGEFEEGKINPSMMVLRLGYHF